MPSAFFTLSTVKLEESFGQNLTKQGPLKLRDTKTTAPSEHHARLEALSAALQVSAPLTLLIGFASETFSPGSDLNKAATVELPGPADPVWLKNSVAVQMKHPHSVSRIKSVHDVFVSPVALL